MSKHNEKHTGAEPYTEPNIETAPDDVDTTYGKDMSKVDTDDSTTLGEEMVASGEIASTSGTGGVTSRENAPTPKVAKDSDESVAADKETAKDAPPGGPGVPSEADTPEIPADKENPELPTAADVPHLGKEHAFVVFVRTDGTKLAVQRWDVVEVAENADGTVTVVLPSRDVVTGPGVVTPMSGGVVRVTVQGPFDDVLGLF